MKLERIRTLIFPFIICTAVLSLISCGPKARIAVSQLDTPGHHTFTGLKLLDLEKYPDARREFSMAIELNKNYSKAYTGLALVNIFTGKFDTAAENLTLGLKNAKTDDEKLFVNVARIRYYTSNKSEQKWLESAKNQFDEAVVIDSKHTPAYYFMGLAYKEGLQFNQALEMFSKVVQLKTDHVADADAQLKFLQKIQLARPATEAGKRIALVERITRADTAALFMEEVKIKELFKKPEVKVTETPSKEAVKDTDKVADTTLKEVRKVLAEVLAPAPVKPPANDIADHPFRKDIEGVLETGVRGLENDPKSNFNPNEVLSRGEFAIMLEDILMKLTGEKDLAARYVSSKSLFPDVPADMPYFNAIISVTSREIMEAKNVKTGEFAPLKPLSGVEAL
ncbi:MAG: tetratricopeptide repeat protein, partial [Smithella sp.]|nr:tetratricopeptide repeat protein [Smithella sp.]